MENIAGITVALIGGGQGGKALLDALSLVAGVKIKYLYDIDPNPVAKPKAEARGIPCWHTSEQLEIILTDPAVHLILDVTGDIAMYRIIEKRKLKNCRLIGGEETLILFHLLELQQRTARALDLCRLDLEERVKQRTQRLEEVNEQLIAKIAETEALNNTLQQVNDAKTRYLLQSTHQLKAPFAAIQSYVEMILEGYCGPMNDEMRGILEKINHRCQFLSTSIREMLELANLKSYVRDNLVIRSVRIGALVREITEENAARCAHRGLNLSYRTQNISDAIVAANPQQMHTLLSILLDNAINYSHDYARISIELAETADDRLILQVRDEGIGIPAGQIDKICREYFRCNNAVSKHHDGSGLGLAIAREIVQLHKFTMDFASEPGRGTTVTLDLTPAVQTLFHTEGDYSHSVGF